MAELGRLFTLKLSGTEIAGQRTTSLTINGETVDVTTKDSTSQAREMLAAAGTSSITVAIAGVFEDNSNIATVRAACIGRTLATYVLEFESTDTYTGSFQVSSFEHTGEFNGELSYSATLESSGVIQFAG